MRRSSADGTLLREPRRALHVRIAETLESLFTDIAENQPELLARHCTEAGHDWSRVLVCTISCSRAQAGGGVGDAVGDDGKTEGKTFEAVRTAINELAALVGYIINNLNGHHIVVTADHGFLFTETARVETDKSKLKDKPDSTILAKKRYLIGKKLDADDAAWHGKLSMTAGVDDDMEFWIPKGANLFHFLGGARFVHGGAMPQEIIVPVVTVKHIRGKSAQETKTKPVTVQVLGSNHRITSAFCRFQLIQMEAVSERVKPVTLRVAVYDGEEPVTDIQTVKFDGTSGNLDERKKWVNLVLKDRQYSKKSPYRLVLLDVETGIEQQSVEVIIDRAFADDF